MPVSYSWMKHGTSESAAQGIDGAWVARAGFILFGLAVIWITQLRRRAWGPAGTMCHRAFGVSMFGVAAFSTKPWESGAPYVRSEDLLHTVFATTMGLGFIAGVVAVMISRRLPNFHAALPDLAALAITIAVPLFMSSAIWGVLQRAMFLTAGAWYARRGMAAEHRTTGDPVRRRDASQTCATRIVTVERVASTSTSRATLPAESVIGHVPACGPGRPGPDTGCDARRSC